MTDDSSNATFREVPEPGAATQRPADEQTGHHGLSTAMAELARTLRHEHTSEHETLDAVTTAAVAAVSAAEHAAITLVVGRKHVQSQAATSELARRLETLQNDLRDGPCLSAVWEQETVHITDMAAESRWPRFAAAAAEEGIGSMLCFQLFVDGDNLGALNLYSPAPHAFDEEAASVGLIFAAHAAVALAAARQEEQLETALAHRDIIGQAKGVVMERFHVDAAQAFSLLSRLSQERNVKLRELAVEVAADAAQPPASD